MLLAVGIDRLGRTVGMAVVVVLTAAYAVGALHYFTGRDFHNSIYAVPSRAIARTIAREARPEDVVVAEDDSEVPFYLSSIAGSLCTIRIKFKLSSDTSALDAVRAHPPSRVWLVEVGRDGTQGRFPSGTKQWVEGHYRMTSERGYVRQDPTYEAIKRRLEPGPGYRYKATLLLFDHPSVRSGGPVSCP